MLACLAAAIVAIAAAVAHATSPERLVRDYLTALADDDLTTAAALAGLDEADLERWGGAPLGDAGTPDVVEIVAVVDADAGGRTVIARYGERGDDVAEVAFALEPTPLGPFTQWRFAEPPVQRILVGADRHDRVRANGRTVTTELAGDVEGVAAFVPARVEVAIASPYLDGEAVRTRAGTASAARPLVVATTPSARLKRLVDREVAAFLDDCVAQRVLQPAGCPFGLAVPDRLVEAPQWRVAVPAVTSVVPGARTGQWRLEGGATVRVQLTVQRLIDGVVEERDEAVVAVIRGSVVLGDDGVTVTIDPPEQEG